MLKKWVLAAILSAAVVAIANAQGAAKFLTNDDVVSMVKGGQSEDSILNAIQNQGTDFDVSTKAVLQLKKSGISKKILDAMISAVKEQKEAAAAVVAAGQAKAAAEEAEEKAEVAKIEAAKAARAQAATNLASAPATPGQPTVTMLQGTQRQALGLAHTQIVPTRTQSDSLDGLAEDHSLNNNFATLAQSLSKLSMMKSGGPGGSNIMSMALMANPVLGPAMMVGNLLGKKKAAQAQVTDVWAIPGAKSETVVHDGQESFEVQFDGMSGVNPEEYEPVLIRMQPTSANFRLVGATAAREANMQDQSADWDMYASFVEQRVPAVTTKAAPGRYLLKPASGLASGEYGIVLRPVNKEKKFAGSNVAQNAGDGLAFNCVWSFEVQ
jgi:hypothetical protein